eukprot:TRINITY_DN64638_c0_g1_i1.p1 TRINITY_DN64638_c0_g1~~TRINITY_DN64638_c0_g1_i1.p1  ORF type:complete len:153 (+),score=19.23 TRINITY_DN64638_c0_g1_i1:61-519(+)
MARLNRCEMVCPIATFLISGTLFTLALLLGTRGYILDPKDCIPGCRNMHHNQQYGDDRVACSEETQTEWRNAQLEAGCMSEAEAKDVTWFEDFKGDEACLPRACANYYADNFAEGHFQAIIMIIAGSIFCCCSMCGCACSVMKILEVGVFKQ